MTEDDTRYHYGPSGEYRGYTTNRRPGGGFGDEELLLHFKLHMLVICGGLGYLHKEAAAWLISPQNGFLGNLVGFFYYWTTFFPFSLPFRSYGVLTDPGLTAFANLNFLLGIAAFVLVLAIVFLVFVLIAESASEDQALSGLIFVYMLPGMLFIVWSIVVRGISWLFASTSVTAHFPLV